MANRSEEIIKTIRLDKSLNQKVKRYANKNNTTFSECVRKGLELLIVLDGADGTTLEDVQIQIVRQVLGEIMDRHTERLAKLSVKTGITSSAAWFLVTAILAMEMGEDDSVLFSNILNDCKKKGIDYMKVSHDNERISDFLEQGAEILRARYLGANTSYNDYYEDD